jgi:hypothetical protein
MSHGEFIGLSDINVSSQLLLLFQNLLTLRAFELISDLWIGWKIDVVLFLDSCLHVQQRGVLRSLF